MNYSLYIFFGLVPSILWLLFYLRKDKNPEPVRMILKIFFFGFLAALPAVLIEMGILDFVDSLKLGNSLLPCLIKIFIGVAFIEEFLKYVVIREQALKTREFDEPVDAVIYMIIAALGFAGAENILIFFSLGPNFLFTDILSLGLFRFLGATFLHALCSGTLGYFIAISAYKTRKRILLLGLAVVTLLHGLYNFSIIELRAPWNALIPLVILLGLAIFLTEAFRKIKKLKSISRI
ncbi:MAG: PrsW family glutamic-type intramembrane protease [Candidatus Paceibacterota bacterium]|jgi:RsiW-degrading membrane proteinase PrsW (M82 family)